MSSPAACDPKPDLASRRLSPPGNPPCTGTGVTGALMLWSCSLLALCQGPQGCADLALAGVKQGSGRECLPPCSLLALCQGPQGCVDLALAGVKQGSGRECLKTTENNCHFLRSGAAPHSSSSTSVWLPVCTLLSLAFLLRESATTRLTWRQRRGLQGNCRPLPGEL